MYLSYLELLQRVKDGNPPQVVVYGGHVFNWDGHEYCWGDVKLTAQMEEWTTRAQATVGIVLYCGEESYHE